MNLHPSAPPHRSTSPRGLTLIELLVTIVIMVTVLGAVIPVLSPNNDERKIREASRQLSSLVAQAQAQAARDGRAYGVQFSESRIGQDLSGMALEAYLIAEPPAFTGFSEYSRVSAQPSPDKLQYGPGFNGGDLFDPQYTGRPLWRLIFSLGGGEDPIPPRTIRVGDVVETAGYDFLIVDEDGGAEGANVVDPQTGYLQPATGLHAIWLNDQGQQISPAPRPFRFRRLPTRTSDPPLQFPRGIGIDLQASGANGGPNVPFSLDSPGPTSINVLFSPSGAIGVMYRNNRAILGVNQLFLLLGRIENGNDGVTQDQNDYDFVANPSPDDADLAQRRGRINWLNGDSRWVTVAQSGRVVATDNNLFDPQDPQITENGQADADQQRRNQIVRARNFAREMLSSGGR